MVLMNFFLGYILVLWNSSFGLKLELFASVTEAILNVVLGYVQP